MMLWRTLRYLISLLTFPEKSGQVPEKSRQVVKADFEQQFNPALAKASDIKPHYRKPNSNF
jgi:hypothetical protein